MYEDSIPESLVHENFMLTYWLEDVI